MNTSKFVASYRLIRKSNIAADRIARWWRTIRQHRMFLLYTTRICSLRGSIFKAWFRFAKSLSHNRRYMKLRAFSKWLLVYNETHMIRRAFISLWKILSNPKIGNSKFAITFCIRFVFSHNGSTFSSSHLLPGLALKRLLFSKDLLSLVVSQIKRAFFDSAKQLIINRAIVRNRVSTKLRDVSRTIPWTLCYDGGICLWRGEFMQLVLRMWRFYSLARRARRYKLSFPTTINVPLLLREKYLRTWAESKEKKSLCLSFYCLNLLRRSWQVLKTYYYNSKKKAWRMKRALAFRAKVLKLRAFMRFKIFFLCSRRSLRIAIVALKAWKAWAFNNAILKANMDIVKRHSSLNRKRDSFHNWRMSFRQRRLLSVYLTSVLQGTPVEVVSLSEKTTISLHYREADSRGVLTAIQACLYFLGDPGSQSLLISCWKSWVAISILRRTWRRLLFMITKSHAHHTLQSIFTSWRKVSNPKHVSKEKNDEMQRTVYLVDESAKYLSMAKTSLQLESKFDEVQLKEALLSPKVCALDSSATVLLSRLQGDCTRNSSIQTTIESFTNVVRPTKSLLIRRHSPLHIAADECNIEEVRDLLGKMHLQPDNVQSGLVNARNEHGRSPLHLACSHMSFEYADIVILLIECGAHVLALDDDGNSPLDVSVNKSIRLLLKSHVQRIQLGHFTQYERQIYRSRCVNRWKNIGLSDIIFVTTLSYFKLRKGQEMRLQSLPILDQRVSCDRPISSRIDITRSSLTTHTTRGNEDVRIVSNQSKVWLEDIHHPSPKLLKAVTFFIDNRITNSLALDELVNVQAKESIQRSRLRLFTKDRSHFLLANADMRKNLALFKDNSNDRNLSFCFSNNYRDASLLARVKYRERELIEKSINHLEITHAETRSCAIEGILSELSRSSEPELQLVRAKRNAGVALVYPLQKSDDKSSLLISALLQVVENSHTSITLSSIAKEWREQENTAESSDDDLIHRALGNNIISSQSNNGLTSKGGISNDPFSAKLLLDSAESEMKGILLDASQGFTKAAASSQNGGKEMLRKARRSSINDVLSKMFMLQRIRQAFEKSSFSEVDPVSLLFHQKSTLSSAILALRKQAAEAHRELLSRTDAYAGLVYLTGNAIIDNAPLLHSWDLIRARLGLGYIKTSSSKKSKSLQIFKSVRDTALSIYAQLQLEASSIPCAFENGPSLLPLYSRVVHLTFDSTDQSSTVSRRLSNSQECFDFSKSFQSSKSFSLTSYEKQVSNQEVLFFTNVKCRSIELLSSMQAQLSYHEQRKVELSQSLTLCIRDLVNVEKDLPDSLQTRSFRELQLSSSALHIIAESRSRDLLRAETEFSHCSLLLAEAITASSQKKSYRTPPEVVDRKVDLNEAERNLLLSKRRHLISCKSVTMNRSEMKQKKLSIEIKSSTLLVDIDLISSQMASIEASISFCRLNINKTHVRLAQLSALENEARCVL